MKHFLILLTLLFFTTPAFAEDVYYTVKPKAFRTTSVYSNGNNFNVYSPVIRKNKNYDAEFFGALLAGAGLASGRLSMLNLQNISDSKSSVRAFLDPYIVNYKNNNYVLVVDNKDNNWSVQNILGYNDSKNDMFASLKKLETDGNADKISNNELKNANIRFVLLNSNQSLELDNRNLDLDINKIQYIDMKNLRTALGNKNQDGTFGYFYVIIKDNGIKRAYPGRVTFEDTDNLNKFIK